MRPLFFVSLLLVLVLPLHAQTTRLGVGVRAGADVPALVFSWRATPATTIRVDALRGPFGKTRQEIRVEPGASIGSRTQFRDRVAWGVGVAALHAVKSGPRTDVYVGGTARYLHQSRTSYVYLQCFPRGDDICPLIYYVPRAIRQTGSQIRLGALAGAERKLSRRFALAAEVGYSALLATPARYGPPTESEAALRRFTATVGFTYYLR